MLEKLKEIIVALANTILSFLPDSPFQMFVQQLASIPALGYLNYFVPISEMVAILQAWLTAILVFYAYQLVMRWVKLIN